MQWGWSDQSPKRFFFEKKNQKTFAPGLALPGEAEANYQKVFCFFFSKKKALL
jgi:hypothetical protein